MVTRTEEPAPPRLPPAAGLPPAARRRGGVRAIGWPSGGVLTVLLGAVLGAATVALQLVYLFPPNPSDAANYATAAQSFPSPPADPVILHQYLRVGLIVPMRVAMNAFGYSQASYYAVPLVTGLLLAVSVYALGRLLFSRAVGAVAAVLTSVNSVVFISLDQPLPDPTATALFTAAAAVAVGVATGQPLLVRTPRRQVAALLVVGALLGWSYLVREYIVFVWPVVAAVLWRRVGWRGLVVVTAPVLAVVAGESALNAAVHGDALARWTVSAAHGDTSPRPDLDRTFKNLPRTDYLWRPWARIGHAADSTWLLGALVVMLAGAAVAVLRWRHHPAARWLVFFGAWALIYYVPMVLAGGVLDPSAPRMRVQLSRYWIPVAPAVLLGACATLWLGYRWVAARWVLPRWPGRRPGRRPGARTAGAGLLAGLLLVASAAWPVTTSYGEWGDQPTYRANGATHLEQFRTWLRAERDDVSRIWGDWRTTMVLPLFYAEPFGRPVWDGPTRTLEPNAARPQPGDHVVVYPACGSCRLAARAVLGDRLQPWPGWQPAFTTGDGGLVVYRVAAPAPAGGGPT